MDLFSCRICLTSDKFKLYSLFLSKEGQSFAEMVEFSSGIVVLIDFPITCFAKNHNLFIFILDI